jgi:signal transduction histidine kinase
MRDTQVPDRQTTDYGMDRHILVAYGRVGIPLSIIYALIAISTFRAPATDLVAATTLACTGLFALTIASGALPGKFVHGIPLLLMFVFGLIAKHEDGFGSMVFTVLPAFTLILRFLAGPWSASVFAMGLTAWGGVLMAHPDWVEQHLDGDPHPFNHAFLVILGLANIFVLWFAGVPAGMLKKANAKLEKTAAELEMRVAERTRELARSNSDLEATNAGLDAFSRSVSHDLRAPLRAILGYTKVILEDDGKNLSMESIAYLEYAIDAANRSNELIDAFLELAKSSTKPLEKSRCDLSEMARNSIESLRRQNPTRDPDIAIHPGCLVFGDRSLLRSVVENLLSNAWKYTGKVPHPKIEFLMEVGTNGPVFLVRDNGAGFDMAHADRLFQNFSRLHSNEDFEGTGMGLSNVFRILERHGGWIKATGRKGEGAEFRFWLPPEPTVSDRS